MSCAAILEELMPLARPFRGSQMFPLILLELSFSYAMLGRFDEVVTPLAEALDLLTTLNNWIDLTGILLTLALLANGRGDADRAAEFLGAHARLMALFNRSQGTESHRYALAADAARATLGDATFAAAYDDGYAWSIEGCIAQARAYLAV